MQAFIGRRGKQKMKHARETEFSLLLSVRDREESRKTCSPSRREGKKEKSRS